MRVSSKVRSGFTLIELLVAIGIIGVLASVVIIAVNPRENIRSARDAERKYNIKQQQNALMQYLIDEGSYPNQNAIPSVEADAKPICTQTVTGNPACMQFDALVSDYLVAIPRDEVEPCPDFTGYQVYNRVGRAMVLATHMGKLSGDADITVVPGCLNIPPSSSSGSSVSSSSPSSAVSSVSSSALSLASSSPSLATNCVQLGTAGSFIAPMSGRLFLTANDDESWLFDNAASPAWSVTLTPGGSFTVSGAQETDTGIDVQEGQTYAFTAGGSIHLSTTGDSFDADGTCLVPAVCGSWPHYSNHICPDLIDYSLIGTIRAAASSSALSLPYGYGG